MVVLLLLLLVGQLLLLVVVVILAAVAAALKAVLLAYCRGHWHLLLLRVFLELMQCVGQQYY